MFFKIGTTVSLGLLLLGLIVYQTKKGNDKTQCQALLIEF
jgi:hypothetical protein